ILIFSFLICYIYFFFFSSRRRHTRFSRDWSSDVCSSDLFPRQRRRLLASFAGWVSSSKGRPLRGLWSRRLACSPTQPTQGRLHCTQRQGARRTALLSHRVQVHPMP